MPVMGGKRGVMPKEYVKDSWESMETRVRVSWKRHPAGHVQIATVNDDVPPEPTGEGDEGWYVNLDRDGLNQLIRHLRRARDQAFGRDE